MDSNFNQVIAFTKPIEGGYTNRRSDSGNWSSGIIGIGNLIGSNMGVGAPALIKWVGRTVVVTDDYMRALPASVYTAIARASYWRPMSCGNLPPGIDLQVFDHGWNRGGSTSVRLLQGLVGAGVDGDCGEETLQRISAYGPIAHLIADLADAQESDYRKLHNFGEFGDGWLTRAAAREAAAHLLATNFATILATSVTTLAQPSTSAAT